MNYKFKTQEIKGAQWNPDQSKKSISEIINLIISNGEFYWNYKTNDKNELILYNGEIEEGEKPTLTFILKPEDFLIAFNNSNKKYMRVIPESTFNLLFEPIFKLKECPFCGKEETVKCLPSAEIEDLVEPKNYTVCCNILLGGCGATSGYHKTKERAIEAWNTRKE